MYVLGFFCYTLYKVFLLNAFNASTPTDMRNNTDNNDLDIFQGLHDCCAVVKLSQTDQIQM